MLSCCPIELVNGINGDMMNVPGPFSDRGVQPCRTPDNLVATESPESPSNGEHLGKEMASDSPSFSTGSLSQYNNMIASSGGLSVVDPYAAHQQFSMAAMSFPPIGGMSSGSIGEGSSPLPGHLPSQFSSTSPTSNLLLNMDTNKAWPASFGE